MLHRRAAQVLDKTRDSCYTIDVRGNATNKKRCLACRKGEKLPKREVCRKCADKAASMTDAERAVARKLLSGMLL